MRGVKAFIPLVLLQDHFGTKSANPQLLDAHLHTEILRTSSPRTQPAQCKALHPQRLLSVPQEEGTRCHRWEFQDFQGTFRHGQETDMEITHGANCMVEDQHTVTATASFKAPIYLHPSLQ